MICEEKCDGNERVMVATQETVEAPVAELEVRESPQESMKRPGSTLEDSAIDCPSPKKPKIIQSEEVPTQKGDEHKQSSDSTSAVSQSLSREKTTICDSSSTPFQDPLTSEPSEISPSEADTDLKELPMSGSDKALPALTSDQPVMESEQLEPEEADEQAEEVGGVSIMFSDEEDGGGGDSKLLSTQMSKQIDRVQMFLKLDRLRRPKK